MAKESPSILTYGVITLLVISAITNYLFYKKYETAMMAVEDMREECEGMIDPDDCPRGYPWPDIGIFPAPTDIDSSDAKILAKEFESAYGVPNTLGVFSSATLSKIFYEGTPANALGFVMVNDPDGGANTGIAIAGMRVAEDGSGSYICDPVGKALYLTDIWCPPGCVVTK